MVLPFRRKGGKAFPLARGWGRGVDDNLETGPFRALWSHNRYNRRKGSVEVMG